MLAVSGVVLMAAISYALPTRGPAFRLSMASAYVSLLFLCIALALGPWNVLRGRPNPVSTDVRRDVGIWAAILGLVHVAAGLQVHMGGKFWHYFLYPLDGSHTIPLRRDAFGFANYTGLGATLILLLLLALSNDLSLRRLGTRRWKALQRWNYANIGLVFVHGIAYQFLERRKIVFVLIFSLMVAAVAILQVAGLRELLSRSPQRAAGRASPRIPR